MKTTLFPLFALLISAPCFAADTAKVLDETLKNGLPRMTLIEIKGKAAESLHKLIQADPQPGTDAITLVGKNVTCTRQVGEYSCQLIGLRGGQLAPVIEFDVATAGN